MSLIDETYFIFMVKTNIKWWVQLYTYEYIFNNNVLLYFNDILAQNLSSITTKVLPKAVARK